jgi:membrane carboxypeptidase/penicillin-binding protein
MDPMLTKIFAAALVFSQVAIEPFQVRTTFDEARDQAVITGLLRAGCAHMRKAFDIEHMDIDGLIATAMEDEHVISSDQAAFRGIDIKTMYVAYRKFCRNEDISDSAIDLAQVVTFYNHAVADLQISFNLTELKPPGMSVIQDSQGAIIHQRRIWKPIDQIPLLVQQAFVAAEDKRFYEHTGIDERAIVRAFIANLSRPGRLQGGSTITQQVVKNLLVGPDVTFERKIREMVLASRLEGTISKSKILELYLNSIYLGRGSWGVEVASQSYFGKSVTMLDMTEAALLAGLAKGPAFYNPDRHPARSVDRTAYVLNRLHDDGIIDASDLKSGKASLPPKLVRPESLPRGSYLADYIANEAKSVAGANLAGEAFLTVHATIHPQLQEAAVAALQDGLSRYERSAGRATSQAAEINLADAVAQANAAPSGDESKPGWQKVIEDARLPLHDVHWSAAIVVELGRRGRAAKVGLADGRVVPLSLGRAADSKLKLYDVVRVSLVERNGKIERAELRVRPVVQGSVVVLDNKSGRILAMAGGFSYPLSQLNRATQSRRQPGSAIKPIVYLAALQRGLQPNTLVRDDAITYPPIGGTRNARPEDFWSPKNYDGREGGILTIRQALEASRNLATARLLEGIETSPPQSLDAVCKLAQHFRLYKDCMPYYPFVLGAQPVRLVDLAAFYAAIANEGYRPAPYSIETITRDRQVVYRHEPVLEQATLADEAAFYQLKAMMQGILARGTARSLAHMAPYVAGKTGTTDGENDAWFIGFSNEVTVAVWVGYDNADGQRRTLGSGRTGSSVAIPIFTPVMEAVWAHYAPKTVLRSASPQAKRHLVVKHEAKSAKSRDANLLPEYLRRDQNGRAVDARFRLLSRKDRELYAEQTTRRKSRRTIEEAYPEANARATSPWAFERGWFGWRRPQDDDDRWRGDRGFFWR